jgi:hypothetical protein
MKAGIDQQEWKKKECSGKACWEGNHYIEWKKNV